MHRIDTAGATVDNKFTEGDPVGGVPATVVGAEWLTAVQEEVATVVEQTGGSLAKGNNGQLYAAISGMFRSAAMAATEALRGVLRVGTQAEVDAGELDDVAVTPLKLAGIADFAMVYPNGGSEATPATVTANSRYIVENPFPGYRVFCEPEIQVGGAWGYPGWYYLGASTGTGVSAHQHDSGQIVVQTGVVGVTNTGNATGCSFGVVAPTASAPCRVRVWKLKGAI